MRTLRRPRLWFALLLGVGSALMAKTFAPPTCWSARLPIKPNLIAVSSDGRHLVTHDWGNDPDFHGDGEWVVHVWDREHGLQRAWLEFNGAHHADVVLSPDETKLAVAIGSWTPFPGFQRPPEGAVDILHYDLASGRLLGVYDLTEGGADRRSERVFFSRDGNLLHFPYSLGGKSFVRDLKNGDMTHHLPENVGDYYQTETFGDFSVYRKERIGKEAKVFSLQTGELQATHDLIGNFMTIDGISRDGQVVSAHGWQAGASPWSVSFMAVLVDASTGINRPVKGHPRRVLSPDGQHIAQFGETKGPVWLTKWGFFKESAPSVDILRWQTDERLATFLHASDVRFSPSGNHIAVVRDDSVIDVYPFPFKTPWGLIVGSGLAAASLAWSIGWLWARWLARKAVLSNS